jgi:hypothetical protein
MQRRIPRAGSAARFLAATESPISPTSPAGQSLLTLGLAAIIAALGLATQSAESPIETVSVALVLAAPMAILASRGHFGVDRWQAPTVGAFVFLFWQLGLAPSMCALADDAHRVCTFDADAVLWGRGIHLMWFVLYALILGDAPREQPPKGAELNARGLFAVQCILVSAFWGIGAFAALQTN